jgi:hypothetical protein
MLNNKVCPFCHGTKRIIGDGGMRVTCTFCDDNDDDKVESPQAPEAVEHQAVEHQKVTKRRGRPKKYR